MEIEHSKDILIFNIIKFVSRISNILQYVND